MGGQENKFGEEGGLHEQDNDHGGHDDLYDDDDGHEGGFNKEEDNHDDEVVAQVATVENVDENSYMYDIAGEESGNYLA